MKKAGILLIFVLVFYVNFVSAVVINVPADYTTIQAAINNATAGDTINVSAGTYNENININKAIILVGASSAIVNITAANSAASAITVTANNVSISGFTISGSIGGGQAGIYISNSVAFCNIANNILMNSFDGIWLGLGSNHNTLTGNTLSSNYQGFEVYQSDYNTFTNNIANSNTKYGFKIDSGNHNTFTNNTANSNGDKGFYSVAGDGGGSTNSIFINNTANLNTRHGMHLIGSNIGTTLTGNIFNGNLVTGIKLQDTVTNLNMQNNKITNNPTGVGIDASVTDVTSWTVSKNKITGNTVYGLSNLGTGILNAEYNWWGDCKGPGVVGPGNGDNVSINVDFTPWLGICIENKTEINSTCPPFETDNITLSADLNGTEINSAWISYTINNTNKNRTYTGIIGNTYNFIIPSSDLIGNGGQNITWNIYANDSINTYKNGEKTFYVRKSTKLSTSPATPDGLNNWYVTEPVFSLVKDNTGIDIYYRWDSMASILYTIPFGLENIPNPNKETAGTLELNWWADFGGCGNETSQNQTFYIDLTNPLITDLTPENNSVVYNNLRPIISAYLDEVYGSNSGINDSSIIMKLDNVSVTPIITKHDNLDRKVTYVPQTDLSEGEHEVYVYCKDKAGRNSGLTWSFNIETTSVFGLQVNSPKNTTYNSKRVLFDIITTDDVNFEYINYADTRPRWRSLCRSCSEYNKSNTLNEGENNITIRATDEFGQMKEENISLFIDSIKPKISKTEPHKNSAVNGSEFYIKYTEDNLEKVELFWNPNKTLENCSAGRNQECRTFVNLTSYDGNWIEYYFEVSDSINTVQSKKTRVFVDTTSPKLTINMPKNLINETYNRNVPFNITVSEDVLLEYIDNSVASPRWRRLTSNADEYGSIRKKIISFSRGTHNIQIRATDKAGNSDIEAISFKVDY